MSSAVQQAVHHVSAAIEGAFLSAGQGLSQGLSVFGTLRERLDALAAALDGGDTGAAAAGLGRMSEQLRGLAARGPVDGAALARLVEGNRTMRRRFDDLVADMRMMVVVSRSARLEAAVSAEQRASVEDFSRTIDMQVGAVQARLDACAAEHGRITALLEQGAGAHSGFYAEFGERLMALAADLDAALVAIGRRRSAGLALTAEAGVSARSIAGSVGTALMALQIGDTTRQRLEHILFAFERVEIFAGEGETATADLLMRLQEAQLIDGLTAFSEEGEKILHVFGVLRRDAAGLVARGLATSGRGSEDPAFMAGFRSRFDLARDLMAACDTSRESVERAIAGLGAMLETLDGTLKTLGATSEELVIAAVNVGLKAARLGPEGRGLVTVAGELKRLSEQLAQQAGGLLSIFETVRREAGHFHKARADHSPDSPSLGDAASTILETLGRDDAMIADVLAGLERTSRAFDVTMEALIHDLAAVLADAVQLVAEIDRTTADGPAPSEAAAETVDTLMLPLYSMAQEREVHAAVMEAYSDLGAPPDVERAA